MDTRITKIVKALSLAAAIAALTWNSSALSINDTAFVGSIIDGSPSSDADEVAYINYLITLAPGGSATRSNAQLGSGGKKSETHRFNRSANVFGSLPNAVEPGAVTTGEGISTVDVTGFVYLYGKFGANGYLWYVGNLIGDQSVPNPLLGPGTGSGLSHLTLFNPGGGSYPVGNRVPDGGATAVLLGLGIVGTCIFRRAS